MCALKINGKRTKALHEVNENIHSWRCYNKFFQKYTNVFDDHFDSHVDEDLFHKNLYVKRSNGDKHMFEDVMVSKIFNDHNNPGNKIYLLSADVGYGKTSFVKHIGIEMLPQIHREKFLFVYLDLHTFGIFFENDLAVIEGKIEKSFLERMILSLYSDDLSMFPTLSDLAKAYCAYVGELNVAIDMALRLLKEASLPEMVNFIKSKCGFTHCLFSIDNIDEGSKSIKQVADGFCRRLLGICHAKKSNVNVCIMLPVRKYTMKFYDTKHYFVREMPPPPIGSIVVKRILSMGHYVENNFKESSHSVNFIPKSSGVRRGRNKSISKTITITPRRAVKFFELVVKIIDKEDGEVVRDFISKISNNNLKILIKAIYYIFHSCKLSYSPLFQKVFGGVLDEKEKLFSFPIIIECLMSVHYPFYDKSASIIKNIFNCSDQNAGGDYKSTLIMPRIMLYLLNYKSVGKEKIIGDFIKIKYDEDIINKALEYGFDCGIFSSECGMSYSDVAFGNEVYITGAGRFYIYSIISDPRYLHFISEDVLMDEDKIVQINKKYRSMMNHDGELIGYSVNKDLSIRSINLFISFLEDEERNEWNKISDEFNNKEEFLSRYGVHAFGGTINISEYLRQSVERTKDTFAWSYTFSYSKKFIT